GERPGVELPQRCELGLAAEAAEPPVRCAVGTPGYAVAVAVEGVGERQNLRLRHGLQQPEPQQARRRPMRRAGGLREPRLLADPERGVQGRGDAVLDDRPAYCAEVVEGAVMERGLVRLHFLAAAADDGVFMALAARGVVEKGAQPRSGREFGLEHAATPLEQGALTERQERQRIAGLASSGAAGSLRKRHRARLCWGMLPPVH